MSTDVEIALISGTTNRTKTSLLAMKERNNRQERAPGRHFDNVAISLILHWMHPLRLKAIPGLAAAVVALFAATGCETDGETVPVRTATTEAPPVLVASAAETPAPVKLDKPAAAADISTNDPAVSAALTTAEATAKAAAEVGATNIPPSAVTANTTNAPAITEEIPPARPANLNISEATEKILKLTESNLDEKVILTFVEQTPTKFDLDADEIVYLSDVGVPSTVIAAMLKHDGDDPSKAEHITNVANTENVQPAIPANTNLPPAIAQNLPQPAGVPRPAGVPPPVPQGQGIEVTTNYIPNQQQVIVQQAPQTVVVEQQPTVVYAQPETVTYFYDSLSPYGSWFYVSDYGWCWQPTVAVVDHGWRPYGPRGHWVWTDAGWYWASDYSWGWAPFHYGRWHMHGTRGWVWVPDRTWGPAWVTWRSYGDYCGWAPLPPAAVFRPGFGFTYFGRGVDISFGFGLGYDAFCFAPVNRFHYRRVYDYCLPRHETVRVYAHSHVANHWEFGRGERAFVNRSGSRLETGARPAVIRTMSDNDRSRFGNRERVERGGRETVIYRPPSPPPTTSAPRVASGDRRGATAPGAAPTWSPRTRAEVATRPSTTSGIATPAGQPNVIDSRRFDRGSSDRVEGRPQVSTRPSEVINQPPPTRAGAPQVVNPATRVGRGQITGLPAPSTTTPSPTSGGPAPSTSTPGIGNTANTASRITPPTTVAPPPRAINRAGESPVFNPRRSVAEAEPVTTPVPETAPSRREFPRTITRPTTPAPAPTTVTPNVPTTINPRTVAPPPQTVAPNPRAISPPPETVAPPPRIISPPPTSVSPAPRSISPPISTPAPTRISPSAPSYSAPTYTPPMRGNAPSPAPITRSPAISSPSPASRAPVSRGTVIQAPSSRGGEPSRAGTPNVVSPNRRGRD